MMRQKRPAYSEPEIVIQGLQLLRRVADREVVSPSPDYGVELTHYPLHWNSLPAVPCDLSNLASNRLHRFLSWPEVRKELARLPDHSLMKVEPQKLEAFSAQVHQMSLGGVQSQLQLRHNPPNHLQCSLCLLLASAGDHEVVGVSAESS